MIGRAWEVNPSIPRLSLGFARDDEPFGRLRAMSRVEWPAEPKDWVCSGVTLPLDKLRALSLSKGTSINSVS